MALTGMVIELMHMFRECAGKTGTNWIESALVEEVFE